MKDKHNDATTTSRRGFLKGALTAGGAVLAGAAVGQAQAAAPEVPEQAKPGKQGYHETQHVRHYYATARI